MRELVAADVERVMNVYTGIACSIVNAGTGVEHQPQLFFLQVGDKPGEVVNVVLVEPDIIHTLQASRRTKDTMTEFIRQALGGEGDGAPVRQQLRKSFGVRPDMAVFITEAWVTQETPETVRAGVRVPPSQHPDRRESLILMVHVKQHTYTSLLPIVGTGKTRHIDPPKPFTVTPDPKVSPVFGGAMTMQGLDDLPELNKPKRGT